MKRVNWMLGAWTGVVMLFLYIPIVILVLYSFNSARFGSKWEGTTTVYYRAFWNGTLKETQAWGEEHSQPWYGRLGRAVTWASKKLGSERAESTLQQMVKDKQIDNRIKGQIPLIVQAFFNSMYIGGISTILSVILGTLSAWLIYKYRYPFHAALNTLVAIPMIVPEIIMGISMLMLFSALFRFAEKWGMELSLGYTTTIIAHVTFSFPYVMITLQARLAGLDPSLEEAALDLGATPAQAFMKVLVPYLMPAIVSGALMAFTLSLDDFVVTYFCGSAESRTLPVFMYGATKGPPAMLHVVSTLMIVTTVILVCVSELTRRMHRA